MQNRVPSSEQRKFEAGSKRQLRPYWEVETHWSLKAGIIWRSQVPSDKWKGFRSEPERARRQQ